MRAASKILCILCKITLEVWRYKEIMNGGRHVMSGLEGFYFIIYAFEEL